MLGAIAVLNHLYHHRAQLTTYLRLNEKPVPALYGPSADEPGALRCRSVTLSAAKGAMPGMVPFTSFRVPKLPERTVPTASTSRRTPGLAAWFPCRHSPRLAGSCIAGPRTQRRNAIP